MSPTVPTMDGASPAPQDWGGSPHTAPPRWRATPGRLGDTSALKPLMTLGPPTQGNALPDPPTAKWGAGSPTGAWVGTVRCVCTPLNVKQPLSEIKRVTAGRTPQSLCHLWASPVGQGGGQGTEQGEGHSVPPSSAQGTPLSPHPGQPLVSWGGWWQQGGPRGQGCPQPTQLCAAGRAPSPPPTFASAASLLSRNVLTRREGAQGSEGAPWGHCSPELVFPQTWPSQGGPGSTQHSGGGSGCHI